MHRGNWAVATILGIIVATLGSTGPAGAGELPARCTTPPLTMRLEAGGEPPVGGAEVEITDAVAQRVPIVPVAGGATSGDPEVLERQREQAARTDLALYSLFLADFRVPRKQLRSSGLTTIEPPSDAMLGTLSLVPPTKRGFRAGDVARGDDLRYETTTTFGPLGLTVVDGEHDTLRGFTDVDGRVKILALDEKTICLDVDVELRNGDELVTAAKGTVAAPVVHVREGFYFT